MGLEETGLKRYLPLIGVFTTIIALTSITVFIRNVFTVEVLSRTFMAYFFLIFGSFKAYNLSGFQEAFQMYDLIAKKSSLYSRIYPFLEIGLGLSYLYLSFNSIYAIEIITHSSAIAIMGIGAIGVFEKLREHEEVPCACLGNLFNIPMTKVTLGEDLLMASMALWMLIPLI